jgi:hypothetical protein
MQRRVLVAIPHYHAPTAGNKRHGSLTQSRQFRVAALAAALAALHETFGPSQCVLELREPRAWPANGATECQLHVVVCTTRDRHVLDDLGVDGPYFEHRQCDVEPPMLGFECHEALRERLGGHDYYGYLEDDLVIHDPWFFHKLDAFREAAGTDKLLLPNRFERMRTFPYLKAYIDGPVHPRFVECLRQPPAVPQEILHFFESPILLRRPSNPHSGCFFLNQAQMVRWATRPYFLERDSSFVSPLESAATLGIARTFATYKPTPRVANFLEVEHGGKRWIEKLLARGTALSHAELNDGSPSAKTPCPEVAR